MVYQSGRALERVSLGSITGESPSVHSSEEVPGLWISDCGLRKEHSDCAVRLEVACRQGRSDLRLRGNADDQTDDGGGNRAVFEGWHPTTRSSLHANVELLAWRGERVPDHSPPAIGWYGIEVGYFHLEH